ncbi:MAG: Translation initiation factor IF-2 [Parcubacteria group bacterium GW2011_GWE2_39_37]|uniref:Translation initiation factor IF-2 n=1 Tax=Candidatus Falkowbacteria bacterium GW2011_GWF2_39_8 TaxID=1618642 RepID=A0A0G0Q0R5_9BACT|nr:MAG: Translation initiation factor IF-2 [Parcubacteria group bacterium GW2011_GWE2_39_37]KKR33939.1 MAG: Translation initiation factor IF-2 [Candidatus Falkowbacteria bacterium GW2011_GWF2_39_8]
MNLTELARILKITPQELRDKLPLMGFHIGQKAIKVDNRTASKIINQWPILYKRLQQAEQANIKKEIESAGPVIKKEVKIPAFINVRDFAALAGLPINRILAELMKNSIFASLNEKIDFETASIIGSDLGLEIIPENESEETSTTEVDKLSEILKKEEKMEGRPPVIVVMGHVDHGKTKLLDAIRTTDVVAGEAGGITQHIGAYQVTRKNKILTFIDTPGHEAFTAMRSRGAKVADIAVLVVAADDGVKPQTVEAYRIIEAAKLPFIVAINKIDKPEADINKTKQELSTQLNITPEDWGGKTICVPISAKVGTGIEDLLDMILLTADMETENIMSNPLATAAGTVVDSKIDKGEGPVATVLIQNGTLRIGDQLIFNGQIYGKVKSLKNYRGENIAQAEPSVPVKIIGLKITPEVGDLLETGDGEKIKIKKMKSGLQKTETKYSTQDESNVKKINLIIKSDVFGSIEAIQESLEKIGNTEVKADIVYKGLGNIIEGDVARAESMKAQILGFNVKAIPKAEELAREKRITIKTYRIIYDLIDDVKQQLQALLEPEVKKVELGKLVVKAIFRSDLNEQIVGGRVLTGQLEKDSFFEVERGGKIVDQGNLLELKSGKEAVTTVDEGQDCGMKIKVAPIKESDVLIFYKEEKVVKKL